MIEINLMDKPKNSRARLAAFASVCALLVFSAFLYARDGRGADSFIEREKNVSVGRTPIAVPVQKPERKQQKQKVQKREGKPAAVRVAAFVKMSGKNFAMLVSGRRMQWVEEGQSAFGVKIKGIKEEGVFTASVSGKRKKLFFPLNR